VGSALKIDQLGLEFGDLTAVADFSLTVPEGSFVALTGPSGCGKTSILRAVAGLLPYQRGQIWLAGRQVLGPTGGVGMAFQQPSLLPWRTALENILLALEVSPVHKKTYRAAPKAGRAQARELLARVGLAEFENAYPRQLSGGMQQRVSLCRALIPEPGLLLLDEPFGALDAFTREELWGVVGELAAQTQCTVILVTHDLREAVHLADRVVVLRPRPGRISAELPIGLPRPRPLVEAYSDRTAHWLRELRQALDSGVGA
jgi:NitT/TauT family transport system ATP-binding protein